MGGQWKPINPMSKLSSLEATESTCHRASYR